MTAAGACTIKGGRSRVAGLGVRLQGDGVLAGQDWESETERLGWRKKRSDSSVTITLHIPSDEAVRGLCAYGSKFLRGEGIILWYERGTQCVTLDSQSVVGFC